MSLKVSTAALVLVGAGLLSTSASAAPIAPAAGANLVSSGITSGLPVETVQYYHNKRRYCWHWDGWHGPGWYWCGYHNRRGYGWGGGAGWNRWGHPPRVERRGPPPRRYYREDRRH